MKNLISVIIPTKNRANIVTRAIESVIKQEDVKVEIIVVNDGSSDNTEYIVKNNFPNVKLINNKKSVGGAKARNLGFEEANGDFVAFLDSDDEWLPNHLICKLKSINMLNADGAYGTFFLKNNNHCKAINFYNRYPSDYKIADKIASLKTHDARTSTFVFRKEAFKKLKFDENLQKHQDWDLAINFENRFKLILDNNPTAIIHVDSLHPRMSNKLNHEATLYFLEKNKNYFKSKSIFNFCLKMIMRCQSLGERESILKYLHIISNIKNSLSAKDRLIYYILNKNIINLNTIRLIKNSFKKV